MSRVIAAEAWPSILCIDKYIASPKDLDYYAEVHGLKMAQDQLDK